MTYDSFRLSSDGVNTLTLQSDYATITPQTPGWEDDPMWRKRSGVLHHQHFIDGIFVGYNEDGVFQMRNYTCQAEMIRDYAKEVEHNDGYAYWRTTGRTIVTWASGEITYFIRKEVYTYSVKVIDLGYDESLPF